MTLGFCLTESADVAIGPDRRCLADGAWALPPSTGCVHQHLLGVAWSACDAERPCRPVAPGTWRAILGQQAKAVAKRDRDRAARQFAARSPKPPTLATARKPARLHAGVPTARCAGPSCPATFKAHATRRGERKKYCSATCANQARRADIPQAACPICGESYRVVVVGGGRRRLTCSRECARELSVRTRLATPGIRALVPIPCPICSTPFKATSTGPGKPRRMTCSVRCGRIKAARTRNNPAQQRRSA